jgi:hypothetical protein
MYRAFVANIEWLEFRLTITGFRIAADSPTLMRTIFWFYGFWWKLAARLGFCRGYGMTWYARNGQDPMEQQMREMAKDMGVEIDENYFKG